jgi:hypothetical protein
MSLRNWTTIEGHQMRFFVSGAFSTVGIGDWFAIQGGFKTFCDKTFLELLDFFCRYFIRRSNVFICPPTGPLGFE